LTDFNAHLPFMKRAIDLAEKGLGSVAPNPTVGCVIVHNQLIIGEGYHQQYGGAHAEVNAVRSVTNHDLLSEATVYVTLEPCAHFGKTPPCANLLIEKKVKKVVVAVVDPFPQVSGKGIQMLLDAGIEVETGIMEKEARFQNRRFLTYIEKKRPYVILKYAQSADRFIDINRNKNEKGIHWITEFPAQQLVHLWRSQEPGILVGGQTVLNDNPSLTVRHVSGKNPSRFVVTGSQTMPTDAAIFSEEAPTFILPSELRSPESWLSFVAEKGIQSIIVEGGSRILQAFIEANLWDEARVFTGQHNIVDGLKAPLIPQAPNQNLLIGNDQLHLYFNT